MNKSIVISLIASAALAGTAIAQTPAKPADKPAPAGKPAAGDKAAPPTKTGTGTGTGTATGTPGAKPTAGDKATMGEKGTSGMEMPKPSEELLAAGKRMQGNWKCTGTVHMPDGTSRETVANIQYKLDLDKMWIVGTMKEKKSKAIPHPYAYVQYRTLDSRSGKWQAVMVDNMGGWAQASTTTASETSASWEGKGSGMGMTMWSKETEEMRSPKEFHVAGTMSMDGKKWMPSYDVTCKK